MFDYVDIVLKCPYCGERYLFDVQTKDLTDTLTAWKVGDSIGGPKYGELDCTAQCHSVRCQEFADKRDYVWQSGPSGFGRLFDVYIKVESGRITNDVRIDVSEHETDAFVARNKKKWATKYEPREPDDHTATWRAERARPSRRKKVRR